MFGNGGGLQGPQEYRKKKSVFFFLTIEIGRFFFLYYSFGKINCGVDSYSITMSVTP